MKIITREELQGLPATSVVLDSRGLAWQRSSFLGWRSAGGRIPLDLIALPATILHEGKPRAEDAP